MNCAADQTCNLTGGSPGTCINNTSTTPPATCTGECARCEAACDTLLGCGDLDAPGLAGCKMACGTFDAALVKAAGDCVTAAGTCGPSMSSCLDGGFEPSAATPPATPSDDPLAEAIYECKDDCDSYGFFGCFEPGELDSCRSACEKETLGNLEGFDGCNGGLSCEWSCFDFLTNMEFAEELPPVEPNLVQQCESGCSNAGLFPCSSSGAPALSPTEVASCKASCKTKSNPAIEAMTSCWDAAFFSACGADPDTGAARACFSGWL